MRKADPCHSGTCYESGSRHRPEEYMGDVIGRPKQLAAGRFREWIARSGAQQVMRALVPLVEMFGYATDYALQTQGRAVHHATFSHTLKCLRTLPKRHRPANREDKPQISGAAKLPGI
jgi:translation elongation factor EF-G